MRTIGRGRYATETYPDTRRSALGGLGNVIAWRPDGSGSARTWADVMTIIRANVIPMLIDVTAPFTYEIPAATTPYDVNYGSFVSKLEAPMAIVDVLDGAVLKNLTTVISMGLRFHPTTADALTYSSVPGAPGILALQRNGMLQNQGTVPILTAQPAGGGPGFVLASFENGGIQPGTAPLVAIANGALAIFEVISAFNTGGTVPANLFSGPVGSTLWLFHDGTLIFPFTPQPAFLGTLQNIPLGCSPSGGPTALRPIGLGPLSVGVSYFDQGILPPRLITWDGTQWVDGAGTVVP